MATQNDPTVGRIVDPRKVWVIHGRNLKARDAMFQFLRAIDLNPLEWDEASALTGETTPYVGNILEHAFAAAQAAVVLITGDDVARAGTRYLTTSDGSDERELTPQARPNVLFEAGMAFGKYPTRTILVELGRTRAFSDVAGRHSVRISNSVEDRQRLADRLRTAKCSVKTENRTGWHRAGDFDGAKEAPDSEEGAAVPPPNHQRKSSDHAVITSIHAISSAPVSKPCVSLNYKKEGLLQTGFEYMNYGPGPVFHVNAGPLDVNGYKVTFPEIAELAPGERSPRRPAKVTPLGAVQPVTEDDVGAALNDSFADLPLCFEDASGVRHRQDFEIRCDFFGSIEVRRKPGRHAPESLSEQMHAPIARDGALSATRSETSVAAADASIPRLELQLMKPASVPHPSSKGWSYYSLRVKWINDIATPAYEVVGTLEFAQRHNGRSRGRNAGWFTWEEDGGERKYAGRTVLRRKDVRALMLLYADGKGKFGMVNSESPGIATSEALDCGEWFCLVKVTARNAKPVVQCLRILIPDEASEIAEIAWQQPMWRTDTTWSHLCFFCSHGFNTASEFNEHLLRNH